jgi:hypothetical protein
VAIIGKTFIKASGCAPLGRENPGAMKGVTGWKVLPIAGSGLGALFIGDQIADD